MATVVTVYTSPEATGQIDIDPVGATGAAGIPGLTVTAKVCALLVPHELVAVTVMFPATALPEVATVTELVVPPEVILHPVGTVQV